MVLSNNQMWRIRNVAHTKCQESVNGNVAETCETVPETRPIICVSVSGFVTFTRVSVAAYTAEPDHFLFMFPSCFSNRKSIVNPSFAETHENVAEICLFHVSADVFPTIAIECAMEPAETQETIWKLMPVLCSRY